MPARLYAPPPSSGSLGGERGKASLGDRKWSRGIRERLKENPDPAPPGFAFRFIKQTWTIAIDSMPRLFGSFLLRCTLLIALSTV